MRLDISKALKHIGQDMPFAYDVPLRDQDFMGEEIHFVKPAHIEGVFIGSDTGVRLMGRMNVEYTRPCSMCLEPVKQFADCEFEDDFTKEPDPDDPNDLFTIESSSIDLTGYAESLAFLDMPMTVKCRPDCRGLCPICGKNLNSGQCSCGGVDTPSSRTDTGDGDAEYPMHRPFAALQDLLSRDEEV